MFSHLKSLKHLDLSYLNATNALHLSLFSPLQSLHGLHLEGNIVSVANMSLVSNFPSKLGLLRLSGCNSAEFPEFIRKQNELRRLDLSYNKIQGQVPDWIWRLPHVSELNLSHNSFTGFEGSSQGFLGTELLRVLDIRSNAFQGPLFIPPPSVRFLFGSGNNFSGEIPQSICGLTFLLGLDLSNNSFTGSIPMCLGNMMILNLGNNHLSGSLPDMSTHLQSLNVCHNRLVGKLPKSLVNCSVLQVLNVKGNAIKDEFPFWLHSLLELQVLVLNSNEFHGPIYLHHLSFGFPQLRIIDISHNQFNGTLPPQYFANWKAMKSVGNSADEYGSIYMESFMSPGVNYLDTVVLVDKGIDIEFTRILKVYTHLDFSDNRLEGHIPESIGLLKELRGLNLSSNALASNIPISLANLTKLESLDLSHNKLSGKIPPELGNLASLEKMNFSYNQLDGEIPKGTQFGTQDASAFQHNLGLCGLPLNRSCGKFNAATPLTPQRPQEPDEELFSWIAAAIGLAPGMVFGLAIGHIVGSYKHEWFMYILARIINRRTRRTRRTR